MDASGDGVQWRLGPGDVWEYLASDGGWYPPDPATGPKPPQAGVAPSPLPAAPTGSNFTTCPSCGQPVLLDRSTCSSCGAVIRSPVPMYLTSAGRRLGQECLDILLAIVTLGIGWLIWNFVIWGRGQTPGMQLLHFRVVKKDTLLEAGWGDMALRQIVGRWLIMGLVFFIFFPAGLVLDCMLLWDQDRQQLWDKLPGTIVVNGDPGSGPSLTVSTTPDFASYPADGQPSPPVAVNQPRSSTTEEVPATIPGADTHEAANVERTATRPGATSLPSPNSFDDSPQPGEAAPTRFGDAKLSEPQTAPDSTDPANWQPPATKDPE